MFQLLRMGPLVCLAVLLALDGAAAAVPAQKLSRFEYVETHMGSQFKVILYTEDEPTARRASRAAFERIAALDAALSDYRPDSELMRLCDRAGGPPVAVSADLFDILSRSRVMYERSGGAFDVTIGPVVRLWRRARRDRKLPDPARLADARALVGSDKMQLDPAKRTVALTTKGMKLDLGAIAKGYASDEAIQVLKRLGVSRALVAGAGDIVVSGAPPGTIGWTIGVAPLEPGSSPPHRSFLLHDAAVSTSGDTERYVEIGGRRYSHIVDPKTGLGVVDRSSVTVIAGDGATADALDTSVYLLGSDRGLPLVESTEGAAALIVRATATGPITLESKRLNLFPTLPLRPREHPLLSAP